MKLKDLLADKMAKTGKRQVDLAQDLGVSKQVVFANLNRDLDRCSVKTVREYAEALGMKWKPLRMVKQQK